MSWLGVQLVTDAFDTIVKAMENEMLSDEELKELRGICQNAVDICDKWIAKDGSDFTRTRLKVKCQTCDRIDKCITEGRAVADG